MKRRMKLFLAIITLTLAACGASDQAGGDRSKTLSTPTLGATPTANVGNTAPAAGSGVIGTEGTLGAGVSLYGVGVIVTLPTGVTVATDSSGTVAATVAVVSGVAAGGSMAPPVYTPATATAKATFKLIVAAAGTGFGTGEFVTVTCNLPAGNVLESGPILIGIDGNFQWITRDLPGA